MSAPFAWLRVQASACARCALCIAAVLTGVFLSVLAWQGWDLQTDAAPLGIVSLQIARDAAEAHYVILSWQHLKWTAYAQVGLDLLFFIPAYSAALFLFGRYAQKKATKNQLRPLERAARLAALLGLAAGASDFVEDIGLLTMLFGWINDWIAAVTSFLAALKFTLIVASLVLSTVAALSRRADAAPEADAQKAQPRPQARPPSAPPAQAQPQAQPPSQPAPSWGATFQSTRAVVGVLLLTGLALLIPPQTRDMLAGVSIGGGLRGIWSAAAFQIALCLLAVSAWHWARAVLSAQRGQKRGAADSDPFVWVPRLLFIAVAVIGIIAAVRSEAWGQLFLILAWAALGIFVLYNRVHRFPPDATFPSWVARLPVGSRVRFLVANAPLGAPFAVALLVFALAALVAGSVGTFFPEWFGFLGWLTDWLGYAFPGPAVALLFLAFVLGPLTALSFVADRVYFGGSIRGLAWSIRPPLFLFLLAAILVVPTVLNLHAVRVVAKNASYPVDARDQLGLMFKKWVHTCFKDRTSTEPIRPLIVALSGGASRAGLWGARVLHEADALAAAGGTAIFAVSSVSGGSLGAAAYVATVANQPSSACTLAEREQDQSANQQAFKKAVLVAQGDDALGPLLAGSLFGDVPRALLAVPAQLFRRVYFWFSEDGPSLDEWRGGDRADALESAFERNWRSAVEGQFSNWSAESREAAWFSRPYLSLAYASGEKGSDGLPLRRAPIWIANGTDAQDGVRILTAPFKVQAKDSPFLGARDALDLLGRDVPISTAIHNTARFPFLSPAGELSPVRDSPERKQGAGHYAPQLIDGGYFENEGLLTARELARFLQQHGKTLLDGKYAVEPILLQATADAAPEVEEPAIVRCLPDGRGDAKADASARTDHSLVKSRPLQFLVPVLGLYNVRGGHSDWILRQVREEYCRPAVQIGSAPAPAAPAAAAQGTAAIPAAAPQEPSAQAAAVQAAPQQGAGEAPPRKDFYHFYLYRLDQDVPLNWVMSQGVSCSIWRAMSDPVRNGENRNSTESAALGKRLGLKAERVTALQAAAAAPENVCPKPKAAN